MIQILFLIYIFCQNLPRFRQIHFITKSYRKNEDDHQMFYVSYAISFFKVMYMSVQFKVTECKKVMPL